MARTDSTEVGLVVKTSLSEPQINAFIGDANVWVTANLVGKGLSTAQLTAIEKYLACYLIGLRDPRLRSTRRSDITDTFVRDASVDPYLQAAIRLDPTGTVESAWGEERPSFSAYVGAGYDDDLSLGVDVS